MSKKIVLKLILLVVVLIIILTAMPLSFWVCQQSEKSISLYVSPDFKLCNYDSFYDDTHEEDVIVSLDVNSFLRENGLKDVLHKEEILKSTLCVVVKRTKGFVFPPYIGRDFSPRLSIDKTFLIEICDGKSLKPLLKLYASRGIFSEGHRLDQISEKLKEGLIQAGWKEKNDSMTEPKTANP